MAHTPYPLKFEIDPDCRDISIDVTGGGATEEAVMADQMRFLSERMARRCEEAREPVCKCRCGGKLHGARRGGVGTDTPRSFFEALPEDDPHFLPSSEWRKQKAREKAERRAQFLADLEALRAAARMEDGR